MFLCWKTCFSVASWSFFSLSFELLCFCVLDMRPYFERIFPNWIIHLRKFCFREIQRSSRTKELPVNETNWKCDWALSLRWFIAFPHEFRLLQKEPNTIFVSLFIYLPGHFFCKLAFSSNLFAEEIGDFHSLDDSFRKTECCSADQSSIREAYNMLHSDLIIYRA